MWITRNLATLAGIGVLACAAWRTVDHWQGRVFPGMIFTAALFVLAACTYDATRDLRARAPRRRTRFLLLFLVTLLLVPGVGWLERRLASPGQIEIVSDVGAMMVGVSVIVLCVSARRRRWPVLPG